MVWARWAEAERVIEESSYLLLSLPFEKASSKHCRARNPREFA